MSPNWQRIMAYSTGSLVLGLLLIILTNGFISFVAMEGTTGYLVLLGFGFVFLNLGFGLNRRYAMKSPQAGALPYLFATLLALPSLAWVLGGGEGLRPSTRWLFLATIFFAIYLGTYYGIRRGVAKRREYLEQARLERREMPGDLKRPHDKLSKN